MAGVWWALARASAGNLLLQYDEYCLQYDPIRSLPVLDEMAIGLAIHVADAISIRFLVAQEYKEKNILVLYSHEEEMSTYAGLDHALRSALPSDPTYPVVFYTEYLDLLRFPEARHQRVLVDYLRAQVLQSQD